MTQYGFFVDVSKCTGCKTCMVACKDGHFAQPGMNLRNMAQDKRGRMEAGCVCILRQPFLQPLFRPCLREGLPDRRTLQA